MILSRETIGCLDCVIAEPPEGREVRGAVILCHGFGAPGQDLVPLYRELNRHLPEGCDVAYIFPAAPLELDPSFDGRAWWMIDVMRLQYLMATGETRQMRNVYPEELPGCRKQIFEIIEQAKSKYRLASEKLIVGGFSQGAMLATDVALNHPEPLGGLIVWSGALICEEVWTQAASHKPAFQVFQSHGEEDLILSIEGARDLESMLTQAGHQVQFQEFNGPHTISSEALELAANLIADCCCS